VRERGRRFDQKRAVMRLAQRFPERIDVACVGSDNQHSIRHVTSLLTRSATPGNDARAVAFHAAGVSCFNRRVASQRTIRRHARLRRPERDTEPTHRQTSAARYTGFRENNSGC